MKRKFVPPRLLKPGAQQAGTGVARQLAGAAAPLPPLAVFDCLFQPHHKKGSGAAEGTLVLRGNRGQLLDLQLREKAATALPAATALALHKAHAAAVAGLESWQPLGPLWHQGTDGPPEVTVGQFEVMIEDDRSAVVQQVEWELRQQVGKEANGGKPKYVTGTQLAANNIGARMLASMGWQPGQGVGKQPGATAPILPQLKWDKAGLGSSTHVKRLGGHTTRFRRAAASSTAAEPDSTPPAGPSDSNAEE